MDTSIPHWDGAGQGGLGPQVTGQLLGQAQKCLPHPWSLLRAEIRVEEDSRPHSGGDCRPSWLDTPPFGQAAVPQPSRVQRDSTFSWSKPVALSANPPCPSWCPVLGSLPLSSTQPEGWQLRSSPWQCGEPV